MIKTHYNWYIAIDPDTEEYIIDQTFDGITKEELGGIRLVNFDKLPPDDAINVQKIQSNAHFIDVPLSWCWVLFEEITINHDGKRIPITSSERKKGNYPYYGASGIIDYVQDYIFDGEYLLIAEDGANLLSRSTPIAFIANGKFWVNNHAHIVQTSGNVIPLSYLEKYINAIDIRLYVSGSAQPKLNQKNLNRIQIPLPPLNEQRRLVAKIESLKARTARVKDSLSTIPALLDQFRQSVLAAAFRGALTADWRARNPDATEWETTTLQELIKGKPRNGYSPKPVDYPTKVKSITLSATTSGQFKPQYFKYINEEISLDSHLWLSPGDVLIQRSNTLDYVGTSAIYNGTFGEFIYPDLIMKIQVIEEKTTPEFIYYALSNKATRLYFRKNATGTAGNMPKINQPVVMNTPVVLPSIEEQKEVVRQIQLLFKLADTIEQQYKQSFGAINQLDQTILAQAFRGALVPQDPNDEPASVLLERIRAEREKSTGATSKRSKKSADTSPSQSERSTGATKARTNKSTPFKEAIQMELELE